MENDVNLVERRQLDAEGDWRVLFQQCKRSKILWSQLICGSGAISWGCDVGGAQQDLLTNFELVATSSPVRLLLLVILYFSLTKFFQWVKRSLHSFSSPSIFIFTAICAKRSGL